LIPSELGIQRIQIQATIGSDFNVKLEDTMLSRLILFWKSNGLEKEKGTKGRIKAEERTMSPKEHH
jgi:hypothetical protein